MHMPAFARPFTKIAMHMPEDLQKGQMPMGRVSQKSVHVGYPNFRVPNPSLFTTLKLLCAGSSI